MALVKTMVAPQSRKKFQLAKPASAPELAGGAPPNKARILVSISGLCAYTRDDAEEALEALAAEDVPVTLLVTPHLQDWHLRKDAETLAWLKERAAAGTGWALCGFDQSVPTNSKAEFAALERYEARLRLTGATRQMEYLGLKPLMFAPPKWLLSPGTLSALPEFGFQLAASDSGIYRFAAAPVTENTDSAVSTVSTDSRGNSDRFMGNVHIITVDEARVLAVGDGFGHKRWWRRTIQSAAAHTASRGTTVRLSVNAKFLSRPAVLSDLRETIDAARKEGAVPSCYAEYFEHRKAA